MKLFAKSELKLLWPFYLETFISTLFIIYPAFYIIQLQATLTLTQIGFLFAALSASSFIFEIPTGAIADIYGRKFSVVLGYFMQGASLILISVSTNFYGLLIAFFLWGIFGTFVSGAQEAWATDNLIYKRKKNLIDNYFIKDYSFTKISLVLAGLIGALFVKQFGINIIWSVTAASFILSGFILIFVSEHKVTKEKKKTIVELISHSKKSMKYSLKHKTLLYLFMALFFVSFFTILRGNIAWQPFLKEIGFPVYAFGILFSGIALFGAIAPYLAKPIIRKIGKVNIFLAFALFMQVLIAFLVLFVNNWVMGIILMISLFFVFDLYNPIRRSYFQKFIPSKMRATLGSFGPTIVAFAYVLSGPLAGYLVDTFGPKITIVLSGLFLIPAIILYLKIKDKTN